MGRVAFVPGCSLALLAGCAARPVAENPVVFAPTHGLQVGEVGVDRARIWARGPRDGFLCFELRDARGAVAWSGSVPVDGSTDHCGTAQAEGLAPGERYGVRVAFSERPIAALPPASVGAATSAQGSFRTAPTASDARPVRFAWSGDLGGQNVGRDAERGFAILPRIVERAPDFFVALGDMIYADGVIGPRGRFGNEQVAGDFGPSATLDGFRAHWRYAREDAGLRELFARVPCHLVWDDHEVTNDFSPVGDVRKDPPYVEGEHLLPLGLRALCEWNAAPDARRLWRSARHGRHVELFFLDNRSHRDANAARDDEAAPKTQLGTEQLAWLEESLVASDATWRFVVSSVPIAIPTGAADARDGWADGGGPTGFERELAGLFERLAERGVNDTVWLTTDVHFATGFEYRPLAERPEFRVLEFVAGPLSAGVFPKQELDLTFHPTRLFFHGPPREPASYEEALGWFNFGLIEVDLAGTLNLEVVDGRGATVHRQAFRR